MDIIYVLNLLMFTEEFLPKWMPCVAKSINRLRLHTE